MVSFIKSGHIATALEVEFQVAKMDPLVFEHRIYYHIGTNIDAELIW